jgi:sterol desaturase/sphingolipid hydroxylase (fatty acid hydroxylase superfamily)
VTARKTDGPLWVRRRKQYYLDKMTLNDLVWAYFLYPAVQLYIVLLIVDATLAVRLGGSPLRKALAAAVVLPLYPVVEYCLHRFLLHAPLYRSRRLAVLWKRIHYDHHRDPNDLRILFGAPQHTLMAVVGVTLPIGAAIAGFAGMAAASSAGLACLMFYEFVHCMQHLRFTPRSRFFRDAKRGHLLHHFHNERGNFGITGCVVDRLVGTGYRSASEIERSATVRNLGYTGEQCVTYPWVERLSEETLRDPSPQQ